MIGYLWTKYQEIDFSDLVPHFFNLARSLWRAALKKSGKKPSTGVLNIEF